MSDAEPRRTFTIMSMLKEIVEGGRVHDGDGDVVVVMSM